MARRNSDTFEGGSRASLTVYSASGELALTSTGDVVRLWKKYFEDVLNPTSLYTPSGARRVMGVCPTSPQGIQPCFSRHMLAGFLEYGVRSSLPRTVPSLYDRSGSFVRIRNVGLHQGGSL